MKIVARIVVARVRKSAAPRALIIPDGLPPPGESTTPSRETKAEEMSVRMVVLLGPCEVLLTCPRTGEHAYDSYL